MNKIEEIKNDVIFNPKPIPVPFRSRISFRVAQITLILYINSGRASCSELKVHIIASALTVKEDINELIAHCKAPNSFMHFIPKFDPCVTTAIRYCEKDEIFSKLSNGNYKLTNKGKIFAKSIKESGIMSEDIESLERLGTLLTDNIIKGGK